MAAFNWYVMELPKKLKVASGSAHTERDAFREAQSYALQYAQDGPIQYAVRKGRKVLKKEELDFSAGWRYERVY
jgi:hypothetical protein